MTDTPAPHKKRLKPRVLYKEVYVSPGLKIRDFCLPTLPSATGFVVREAYIREAGQLEIDGVEMEYQDVRMLLIPKEKLDGDTE